MTSRTEHSESNLAKPIPKSSTSLRNRIFTICVIVLPILAVIGWLEWKKKTDLAKELNKSQQSNTPETTLTKVEVVHPARGGLDRICVQPGTVEPYEAADLYAKVSGFMIEQTVDIGSQVKAGQVLARIAVPEFEKQVDRDLARVTHAEAVVRQMQARFISAQADSKSAEASVANSRAQYKSRCSYRKFREKQLARLKELNNQRAIEAKVVDESEDQYEAALEFENAALEAIAGAEQRLISAKAKIEQSKADIDEAKAEVKVALADLERSRVFVSYAVITSPYDGVVTRRSFNRGDFIRSADVGGDRVPLFSVERTDLVRIVVQVPDRDVPYTNIGDLAHIEIDALPGNSIDTTISRLAESEDAATRTMRTEIDVPNKNGHLRRGMYGRVTLVLEKGTNSGLTVPSASLSIKGETRQANLKILRDGIIRVVEVKVGTDNGVSTEIISGVKPEDLVVVRAIGSAEEGKPAEAVAKSTPH